MQALKALVIVLGVLILLGAGVVAVTIYKRTTGNLAESPSAPGNTVNFAFGTKRIAIPPGAHIDDVMSVRGRLVVRLRLADGSPRLLVLDLDTGAVLGELDFVPAP